MSSLEKALSIAAQAHEGQRDKAGAPYILHPLRVMLKMKTEDEMIVAVLHDVIEDSDLTIDLLRQEGFASEILDVLECLTRSDDEEYGKFIERIKRNPLAIKVKIADLEDNLEVARLKEVTAADAERIEKYRQALQILNDLC
jgi:(p)ppGpp synthase/HD superfamily hydrolase